jgi:hypothetical protein
MPNGFFMNDLLWFGDGAAKKTAISRGFMVEPGEISAFSVTQLNDLHERLRIWARAVRCLGSVLAQAHHLL